MLANSDLTNLPTATWVYLAFYILTLFVHFVFMAYVLGGGVYFLFAGAATSKSRLHPTDARTSTSTPSPSQGEGRGESSDHQQSQPSTNPIIALIRDWMPFAISAAITAGVAPLLFIQILYRHRFYTANLLLLHRWMAIVPVLIVAFYLAYVIKSGRFERMRTFWRVAISGIVAGCFLFVAWSWTENHLLSLDRARWESFYVESRWIYRSMAILPRLLMWVALTLAIMPQLVRWQLWATRATESNDALCQANRRLNVLSLIGLISSAALLALSNIPYVDAENLPVVLQSWVPTQYVVGGIALLLACLGTAMSMRGPFTPPKLRPNLLSILALSAYVFAILKMRELHRIAAVDLAALIPQHESAAQSGGAIVFIAFTVINIVLVGVCICIARRALAN